MFRFRYLIRSFAITRAPRTFLKKPHIDIKYVLAHINEYNESIKKRGLVAENELLANLEKLPEKYDKIKSLNDQINHVQKARNQLEKTVQANKTSLNELIPQIRDLKSQFKVLMETKNDLSKEIEDTYVSLPNLLHPSVPATEPEVVAWINEKVTPNHNLDHVDIMTKKGLLDLKQAAKTSGSSSYYLINGGARLERALINYSIDLACQQPHGYTFVIPPSLTRLGMIDSCGFTPRDMNGEEQIYKTNNEMGLVATAEISLAALGFDKVLTFEKKEEPVEKFVGVSRCYRAEAGARGKETKGLYRVHEFSKVELFCWCKPQFAEATLEQLKAFQIQIIESLGLHAKVLNMPANDLGNPAYKKYDIEVWMPGKGTFGEVSSASNCRDFQAFRLNTKFKDENGASQYAYTLNGTAMAVPRIILALVENFYDSSTDKIKIPDVLVPYMNGDKYI
ncbi:putative serine--tRNA ligase DIA4 KNAG_0B03300 [Huiozyma naganishii CBS 8797]|uniref:serine--tRNA ligase n=1 Tax=Huiozyma naganishii (strain ATCC MYA-139 / BCRC 22969 / CBS 8797 / KCTC 17520 / NBRC 10181 / NCYC 3082 / Yp74L-3) TaxID=1071383 RepID=J7RV46_HUIN7|nr:hypothetical protein KNAG_0B03300 [Kazachstania naganishii CBS 8797]CCK68772.1 hypothetical protein KNAG_0B03300 [Kazachstania naganishii CBS 8797]